MTVTDAGVLSADVRDYDGDGVRDMLVILLTECPMGETALGRLMYGEADPCLAAEMRLYTCTGGAEAEIAAVLEAVTASTGIEMELISEHVNEQTHMVQYAAPEGSILSLCYVLETGKPSSIGVYAKGGDVTQEWIALKDAVLDAECLGFDPDKVEKFHGNCGFRFGAPEDAGADGATVLVGNAVACTMLAQWDN